MIVMADNVIAVKNLVKVKAKRKNKVATFMPKPIFGDNASAMHTHQSLWNENSNVMYDKDDEVAQMSQTGRYYVGGILSHASALCSISDHSRHKPESGFLASTSRRDRAFHTRPTRLSRCRFHFPIWRS